MKDRYQADEGGKHDAVSADLANDSMFESRNKSCHCITKESRGAKSWC